MSEPSDAQGITRTTPRFTLKCQAAKFLLTVCKDVFVKLEISFIDFSLDLRNRVETTNGAIYSHRVDLIFVSCDLKFIFSFFR